MMDLRRHVPITKLAVLAVAMTLVTLSSASASSVPCPDEFGEIQRNHAEAQAVKDVAMANEIIERPDSVLALSCFDQAMAASAKAGHIFSDRQSSFIPGDGWGLPGITPPGGGGGGTPPGGGGGGGGGTPPGGGGGGGGGGPPGGGGPISIYWDFPSFDSGSTLADQIRTVVQPATTDLLSIFGDALSSSIGGILTSAYNDIIGPFLSIPILGDFLSGLLGISMDCTTGADVLMGYILGQGIDKNVSYSSFDDFINQTVDWGTAGMTQAAANSDVLNDAVDDLENMGIPGYFSFMPTTPVIPQNASVDDIINSM